MPSASDPFDDHSHQTRRVCMFIENMIMKRACDPGGVVCLVGHLFPKHMMPPASNRDLANHYYFFFLFKNQYTGRPENMRVSPIIASRGLVTMVLQNKIKQKMMKIAGTTGYPHTL